MMEYEKLISELNFITPEELLLTEKMEKNDQ